MHLMQWCTLIIKQLVSQSVVTANVIVVCLATIAVPRYIDIFDEIPPPQTSRIAQYLRKELFFY